MMKAVVISKSMVWSTELRSRVPKLATNSFHTRSVSDQNLASRLRHFIRIYAPSKLAINTEQIATLSNTTRIPPKYNPPQTAPSYLLPAYGLKSRDIQPLEDGCESGAREYVLTR